MLENEYDTDGWVGLSRYKSMWVITLGVVRPLMLSSIWFNNYRPQRSTGKILFSQASVILSTGGRGGECAWPGGGAWLGGFGMHGKGACMVGGHVWQGCMCGIGHVWLGACVEGHE